MKLLINFFSKLGVDSVSRITGFITLPVITRYLGPDGYGLFSYLFVIVSYFGFFIDFGYLNYGTNKLCEKIESSIVIGKIISLQLLTAIFSYLVLAIAGYFMFELEKYVLLLIFSFTFISQIFAIRYYYLAKNKLYYNSISELAGQLIYAGLVFTLFVKFPNVLTLVILSVIQLLVTSAFLFIPYIRKNKIKIDFNLKSNLKTLKEAYKLGLAYKADGLTSSFVIFCIGIFLTEESVGLYNASYKIYLILLTIVQALSLTLMPTLLKNTKNSEVTNTKRISLIFYTYLIFGFVLSASTYLFADKIIFLIFGEKFLQSIIILKCFSITILLWPLAMFLMLVLLAYNRYDYILLISLSSMIQSIISSLLFVNLFGIEGAGFILPLVSAGTIIVGYYFLKKTSLRENFNLSEIFSARNSVLELKTILKSRS